MQGLLGKGDWAVPRVRSAYAVGIGLCGAGEGLRLSRLFWSQNPPVARWEERVQLRNLEEVVGVGSG